MLVVSPEGKGALFAAGKPLHPLIAKRLGAGQSILLIDCWGTGEARIPAERDQRAEKIDHYLTYNRSDDANRIQDILTGLGYLKSLRVIDWVDLVGLGCAGPWCLLARTQAPFVRSTIVDLGGCEVATDQAFLAHLMIPAIRGIGDLLTVVALIAPGRLCLLKPGRGFDMRAAQQAYTAAGKPSVLCLHQRMPAEFTSV